MAPKTFAAFFPQLFHLTISCSMKFFFFKHSIFAAKLQPKGADMS